MALKLIFFVWLLIVTILSVIPSPDISGKLSDKAIHFVIYFIATLLMCIAFKHEKVSVFLFYSGLVFFYSMAIEIVQFFLPHREFSVGDIMANLFGVLSFSFLYILYMWMSEAGGNSSSPGKE